MGLNNPSTHNVLTQQTVYTQVAEPPKITGTIWNEVIDDKVQNTWQFLDNRWRSLNLLNFTHAPNSFVSSTASFLYPAFNIYDYLFTSVNFTTTIPKSTIATESNTWHFKFMYRNSLTGTLVDICSHIFIFSTEIERTFVKTNLQKNIIVNNIADVFEFNYTKNNTPPNIRPLFQAQYYLLKKQ